MEWRVCLVVPCYNEAIRLDDAFWWGLAREGAVRLVFVDDGSSDHTLLRLMHLVRFLPPGCAQVLALPRRVGRGEAVRLGLLEALGLGCAWVGYLDADGATPVREVVRLIVEVLPQAPDVVLGARVRRLGACVQRRPGRLLLGRLFAWGAAFALDCDVYDTQCPVKFFRPTAALSRALGRPFEASWVFDTELLARLMYPGFIGAGLPGDMGVDGLGLEAFLEVPLGAWRDVEGSKLTWLDGVRAGVDLVQIACWARWGRRRAPSAWPVRSARPAARPVRQAAFGCQGDAGAQAAGLDDASALPR